MKTHWLVSHRFRSMALVAPLLAWATAALAEDTGNPPPQPGYGWGMMGPGMMGGPGGGMMGMGPGMMGGGYGMGPGMMGPGMMGPGMMGGGYGMGPGMMGLGALNLTDDQRSKINKLQDEHRKQDWQTAGKIQDEQAKMRDLYAADTPDPKKIGAVYANIARLQQQMIEANVVLWNSIQAVLTQEQRDQLKQWQRGGGPGYGPGPRGMMGR